MSSTRIWLVPIWVTITKSISLVTQRWLQRYGVGSLLLAWLPVGGDALTRIAGVMWVPFALFWILTFIGKGARYLVVILLTDQVMAVV